jgi:hypothetical protein
MPRPEEEDSQSKVLTKSVDLLEVLRQPKGWGGMHCSHAALNILG